MALSQALMKKYFFYPLVVLIFANSCEQKKTLDPNIFCTLSKTAPGGNEAMSVGVSSGYYFFEKEFWNYLCKKQPASIELIFSEEPKEIWGISKFGTTTEENIDTGKFYFSRTLDNELRQKIDSLLPKYPPKLGSISKDYSRFKHLLSDTTFNMMSLYCDKATLILIQTHKYAP